MAKVAVEACDAFEWYPIVVSLPQPQLSWREGLVTLEVVEGKRRDRTLL
jgi:hypothetical protein